MQMLQAKVSHTSSLHNNIEPCYVGFRARSHKLSVLDFAFSVSITDRATNVVKNLTEKSFPYSNDQHQSQS